MAAVKKAAPKSDTFSPIKTGVDPRKGASGGSSNGSGSTRFLKVEDGEYVDVVPLVTKDEIIVIDQCAIWDVENPPVWTYIGAEDPSHILNVTPNYRAFLPVLVVKADKSVEDEAKIFSMSKTVHGQLLETADTIGKLRGQVLRIKRTGKLKQTRYSINARGMKYDVSDVDEVDVVAELGPLDLEGVQELIYKKFECESWDEFLENYLGKEAKAAKKAAAKPKAKKKSTVVIDDEDEDGPVDPDDDREEEDDDDTDIDALELS